MSVGRGSLLGKYRLVSLLGAGGMAEVWKAKGVGPAGFERNVVVKRVLPHLARDEGFVKMFLDEARLSALLEHPNIVQVHELGEERGEYFMAMEYVRGCDLGHLLRRGAQLPLGSCVAVVQAICRALGYAHALKAEDGTTLRLIHRDVSPSNVMISQAGDVKLLDFGVAKALGSSEQRTETGTLKGKCGYMSPEQVEGRTLDPRSDLFSAGVMLHELLTRRRLFKGASDFITLSMVRAAEVEPPSRINAEVPLALDAVCLRALAREPEARYSSAEELVAALQPFVDPSSATSLGRIVSEHLASAEAQQQAIDATLTDDGVTLATSPDTQAPTVSGHRRTAASSRGVRWALGLSGLLFASSLGALLLRPRAPASALPAPVVARPVATPTSASPAPVPPAPVPPAPVSPAPAPEAQKVRPSDPSRRRVVRAQPTKRPAAKRPTPARRDFDPESALPE